MRIDAEALYELLPTLYRLRDAAQGEPLKQLLAVIAEQTAVVQEGIEQSYDDNFIETCAEWAVPYLGDLIGVRPLYTPPGFNFSARAQVANTLAYRRRKGTAAVLEQLARDVTNYPAVAVEFFKFLTTTQHMNHVRTLAISGERIGTVSLREPALLERIDTPFDRLSHTLDVRRIVNRRGKYNIPNVGLFLFRLQAYGLTQATARQFKVGDGFRYLFNPLGIDTPLFNQPETETALGQAAEPFNAPLPLSRLRLADDEDRYYGLDGSVLLTVNGQTIPGGDVLICNLSDRGDGSDAWAHAPKDKYAIDPVLGRLALPTGQPAPDPKTVLVSFAYGFSDAIGGGEYERGTTITTVATQTVTGGTGLQTALDAVQSGGVIAIADSRTYVLASATPNLDLTEAGGRVEMRAANGRRPLIELTGGDFVIEAAAGAEVVLSGLVIAGGALRVTGAPARVRLIDCTLVPGQQRTRTNEPANPGAPSLVVVPDNVVVTFDRCITGPLWIARGSRAEITHSILDATADDHIAYTADPSGGDPAKSVAGGALTIQTSTVIGRVHTVELTLASNCIFVARAPSSTPNTPPVHAERRQVGCVRYSFVPLTAQTPRRFRCQPVDEAGARTVAPQFTALRFGTPGYAQLRQSCPREIATGADDESEMGVFHDLYQPQRTANLRIRLDEYLRLGLEAGIFFAT